MKATPRLLATALAAVGLMTAAGAQAAGHSGGHASASMAHGGWHGGSRWAAVHGGYRGGWSGYRGGYWGGYRGWGGPRFSFAFGVPVFWGWDPYWYGGGYYYPRETVVYRDVITEPQLLESAPDMPSSQGEALMAPPPAAVNPLGMHYCVSARAYYPDVKVCPEGWAVKPPTQ